MASYSKSLGFRSVSPIDVDLVGCQQPEPELCAAINLFAGGSSVVWQSDLQCSTCEKRIIWQIFTGIAKRCKQSSWLSGIMNISCREATMTVCNTSDNFQPNNSFVFRIDQFAFATSGLGERCGPFCGCARIPKSISWRILAGRVTYCLYDGLCNRGWRWQPGAAAPDSCKIEVSP